MPGAAHASVGKRLRQIREQSGQTIEVVAKQLRLSAGTLSSVERGRANPSLALLGHLAQHFRVDMQTFFDKDVTKRTDPADSFLREFDGSLDPEDWKTLATVARALIRKG